LTLPAFCAKRRFDSNKRTDALFARLHAFEAPQTERHNAFFNARGLNARCQLHF
jgi:hypothetical protein